MLPQLAVLLVIVALDGRLVDRSVHSFDRAVRPRVTWLSEAVLDIKIGAGQFEGMSEERQFLCPHFSDVVRRSAVAGGIGEMRAFIGKHRVNSIWQGRGEVRQEVGSDPVCGFLVQPNEGELGRPVDRHQQVQVALLGPNLGQIDVEVADGIGLELLLPGLPPSTSRSRLMP